MLRKFHKLVVSAGLLALFLMLAAGVWIGWGAWPDPRPEEIPWTPDVIVVLGGGNEARPREALRLAGRFPESPVIVTGDGGTIRAALLEDGLPTERIRHETRATSTFENARNIAPILNELDARRVVIVTNGFHVPRAMAVFRRVHPEREVAASFEDEPDRSSAWQRFCRRRERLAALHHLVVHQLWSF